MFSCSHISKMQLDAINHRIRVHFKYIYIYTICNFYSTKYNKPNEATTHVILLAVHVCVSVCACVLVCMALARATTISPNICAISQCACLPLAAGQPSGLCLSPTLPHTYTQTRAQSFAHLHSNSSTSVRVWVCVRVRLGGNARK